jgi:hypothetical protein
MTLCLQGVDLEKGLGRELEGQLQEFLGKPVPSKAVYI